MTFVRTVLGDIDPAELGVTYAHEHLAIAGSRMTEVSPDFRLDDVDKAVAELAPAQALGLRSVVDAMPCDAGRDAELLAEISRRSGVHVIAPTGAHAEKHYPERHWTLKLPVDEMAGLFAADIDVGIDALDYGSPVVKRTSHRAVIAPMGPLAIAVVVNAQTLYPGGSVPQIVTAVIGGAFVTEILVQLRARMVLRVAPGSPEVAP